MALEGAAHDASREAYALLGDVASFGGPPNADQVLSEASSAKIVVGRPLLARRSSLVTSGARKARLPDKVVLGSYDKPKEWPRPSEDTLASGPDAAWSIIDPWNPFNKRDSFVHICVNSTLITSEYRWWLVLRSIPSHS